MEKPDTTIVKHINNMTREQMASLWRFAPAGHSYFNTTKPYVKIFEKRFQELGNFSPEISKKIGW